MARLLGRLGTALLIATILPLQGFAVADSIAMPVAKTISPIVQLVAYQNLGGKYPIMLGWGSASVINSEGLILSNNHVVMDPNSSNALEAFNVCASYAKSERPKCNFTATLINRDADRDLSILRIDPVDIFGNKVDYSQFTTITPDYNYSPKVRDNVVAIGYPWIGADTMTETQGIVSGTQLVNNTSTYIKTDTLIAGGNSGGALVDPTTEKLVGVPTFGVGWGESMGYALLIKDAKEFIEANQNADATPKQETIDRLRALDLSGYRKRLDEANTAMSIEDSFVSVAIPSRYEFKNYIPGRRVDIAPRGFLDNAVDGVSIAFTPMPSTYDAKLIAKAIYYFDSTSQHLDKVTIGGTDFYRIIYNNDAANGKNDSYQTYFGFVAPGVLTTVTIQARLYDETLAPSLRKDLSAILSKIQFKTLSPEAVASDFTIALSDPAIQINTPAGTLGMLSASDDTTGTFFAQIGTGSVFNTMAVGVQRQQDYEKVENFEDTIRADQSNARMNPELFHRVTVSGNPGYIVCGNNISTPWGAIGDPYNSLISGGLARTVTTSVPSITQCIIKVALNAAAGSDRPSYFLYALLNTETSKRAQNLEVLNTFIAQNVHVIQTGTKTTELTNVFANLASLKFVDMPYRTDEVNAALRFLVRNKVITNTKYFSPYKAVTWGEYLELYVRMTYGFDISKSVKDCKTGDYACRFKSFDVSQYSGKTGDRLDAVFADLGVDYVSYVPAASTWSFDTPFLLRISGGSFELDGGLTEENLFLYNSLSYGNNSTESPFQKAYEKVQAFTANMAQNQSTVSVYDLFGSYPSFIITKSVYNIPGKGLMTKDLYGTGTYQAGSMSTMNGTDAKRGAEYHARMTKAEQDLYACRDANAEGQAKCSRAYLETTVNLNTEYQDVAMAGLCKMASGSVEACDSGYEVLTRISAISNLMNQMRVDLVDPSVLPQSTPVNTTPVE